MKVVDMSSSKRVAHVREQYTRTPRSELASRRQIARDINKVVAHATSNVMLWA